MSYIGLSLGLLGSLHCMLMCGPLVLGVSRSANLHGSNLVSHALIYNTGRIMAYIILGLLFSIVGEAFTLLGLQQVLSVIAGVFLLFLLVLSMDLERFIFRFEKSKSLFEKYFKYISSRVTHMAGTQPFSLGFLNGLLPCGMVYVALIGALSAHSILSGALFMLSFGLGTLPMMMAIMIGANSVSFFRKLNIKRVIPIGQGLLGIYLIIRGIWVELPSGLIF